MRATVEMVRVNNTQVRQHKLLKLKCLLEALLVDAMEYEPAKFDQVIEEVTRCVLMSK